MGMLRSHEIIKIVGDLQARGELRLAQQVAAQYMHTLESTELRFMHLALTARLGEDRAASELLAGYLESGRWFSRWFLLRDAQLARLAQDAHFENLLRACDEQEARYRQSGAAVPLLQVPPGPPPYRLLVAIHGNGFNAQHSAEHWAAAQAAGWLVFHPLAQRVVGPGLHWWEDHAENLAQVRAQAAAALPAYPLAAGQVLLGGFSKGGETAMVLALQGEFGARGFITVGAGGYLHMQPEGWQPLLASPPPRLRVVALYSPYDFERSGAVLTLERLRAAGLELRLEHYCAEGHVFPPDFAERFRQAANWIMG